MLTRLMVAAAVLVGGLALAQPANDTCAAAEVLTVAGSAVTSTTATGLELATPAAETLFSCSSAVKNTVWYRFTPATTGTWRIETCGANTNIDTLIQVYSGASCAALTSVSSGCNDQGGCGDASAVTVSLTSGTTYYVQVAAYGNVALTASGSVALTVTPPAPAGPAPANDLCAGAEVLTFGANNRAVSTLVNPITAAATVEATNTCSTSVKNSVWYAFTAPVSGGYNIGTCGGATLNTVDTIAAIYTGACGATTQVATNGCNDDNSTICGSAISGGSYFAPTLTAGTTYLVQVAAWSSTTLTSSSQVQLEVSYATPAPTNDTCATAEPLTPSGLTNVTTAQARVLNATVAAEAPFACLTTPTAASRSVWYSITPTVSGSYRLDNCPTTARNSSAANTVLAVYTGTCGALVPAAATCNDDSCGTRSGLVANLEAGTTYYVQLAISGTGATAPSAMLDRLQLSVSQLSSSLTDLCSATSPSLALNEAVAVTTLTTTDGGATIAQNNAQLDAGTCFTGLGQTPSAAPGRDVAYQFRADTGGRYSFRLGTPTNSVNGVLYLTDSCTPGASAIDNTTYGPQCITAANRTSTADEAASCVALTANQTVYVWVDENTLSTAGSDVSLEVSRCNLEVEPNDSPATANTLACVVTGGMGVAGDVDFFALGASPAGSRLYAMAEAAAASVNNFDMRLTTETSTLEYDDANLATAFGGSAPVIAGAALTTEPAYLRINYNTAVAAEPYLVYSHVQRSPPTLETEPNDKMSSASSSATNHFTGSITDGGTDVDFFSFTATAGDVIFAALDAVPDKLDAGTTGYNFVLSLVDSQGSIILTSDDGTTTTSATAPTASLTATTPTFPADGLVYRARATGTYGLRVGKTSGTTATPYNLSVSVGCADVTPTISAVSPASGTPSGGQVVTVTGTNFNERTTVRFGNAWAMVTGVTPTSLTVLTPAGSAGEVTVTVSNGIGLDGSLSPGYTFDDPPGLPPNLLTVAPTVGPVDGGTAVTLTGTVFRRDAGVFFDVGGVMVGASSVTVTNSTRLVAITPRHAEGMASVMVLNADGLSATLSNAFEFQGPPSVSTITPNTGLTTGGQTLTIAGRNFRAGTTVRIGGTLATSVSPAPDGLSLTAVTPAAAVNGVVDVIVRTMDGQDTTVVGGFTYAYPAPTVSVISPASGFAVGGQAVTITGTNFTTTVTLRIGGTVATGVTRVSATQLTATTPTGTPGPADVTVTNVDGQVATATGAFRYVAAPTLTAMAPAHGPVQGGTRVTLTGTAFLPGASIFVGGVPAFAVDVSSPTTATAITNSGAAGLADVRVVNPDTQAVTLAGAYTYDPGPSVVSLTPISGTSAGGTSVTITGTGFLTGATVLFGTDAATTVTVVSPTELTAVTPARAVGVVSVVVRNTDNQSAELPRAFRFVAPPTLTAVAPATGDVGGGTVVRLTGSGFNAGSTVTFGGTAATQVSLVSGTELDAVTPAHAPGATDVVVTTDGASATLAGAFTFTRGTPTLTAVAPLSGPTTGGTLLTLTGTGFAAGATITVGGTAATNVTIVSPELARAVIPAHAAGLVDIVLTNDDAKAATLTGGFTYVTPATGNTGLVDAGTGAVGADPQPVENVPGGVSCGCTSFDGSLLSLGGLGLLLLRSRRRRS